MSFVLCTWGYQSRSIENLLALIDDYQIGMIVDVRKRPWSRFQPDFIEPTLLKRFGSYLLDGIYACYAGRLGNDHKALPWMRQPDWQKAVTELSARLNHHAILLLCLERDPANCHRAEVAQEIQKMSGCEVVHLGWPPPSKNKKKKERKKKMSQLSLFEKERTDMSEESVPLLCGLCPYMGEAEHNDITFGLVTLYVCNHQQGYPMFVMPSELEERCPLPRDATLKPSEYLPSPSKRPGLGEEAVFLIEALRWYAGEVCSNQIQEKIEDLLGNIWSNSQFATYEKVLRILHIELEKPLFAIIYQSIVGYQDLTKQAARLFAGSTEDFLFEED